MTCIVWRKADAHRAWQKGYRGKDISMKKKQLLQMKKMKATEEMLLLAKQKREEAEGGAEYGPAGVYPYENFFMARKRHGILKVSVFFAEYMRFGGNGPVYDIFINRRKGDFITYDHKKQKWSSAVLQRLDGISSRNYFDGKSQKCVRDYFRADGDPYDVIEGYQLGIRRRSLEAKHKKITDGWDRAMKQVPGLPRDWARWTHKVGITQNFLVYQYKKKGTKQAYCTWCEKMVPVKAPRHNKEGKCPCCGRKIQYKATGRFKTLRTEEETMYLLQRCGDGFVVREFCGRVFYRMPDYHKPVYQVYEQRRILYDKGLDSKEFYYGFYRDGSKRWIEGLLKKGGFYMFCQKYFRGKIYGKTLPGLSKGVLAATGFREWVKAVRFTSPVEYFLLLRNAPYVEHLVKAGLAQIVKDILDGWQKIEIGMTGSLAKRLGIDRFRLGRLRENRGGTIYLEWLWKEKEQDTVAADEVIRWMEKQHIRPEHLEFIGGRMSALQVRNYLARQIRETGISVREVLSLWEDYLAMAKRLGMDTKDPIVYRVRDLEKRHGELVAAVKDKHIALRAGEIAESFPKVDEVCREVKEKYEYRGKDYLITAPGCIEDILKEGDALHHCVDKGGNYFERIHTRESYILFLRKAEEPEKPYYTLEIEPDGTIRQKRTEYNRQLPDIEKAGHFLKLWQGQLQKKLSREELELAAESRDLRRQEFDTMRKNKVRINGGDYAGKYLVDVLEKDLMEVCEKKDIAA